MNIFHWVCKGGSREHRKETQPSRSYLQIINSVTGSVRLQNKCTEGSRWECDVSQLGSRGTQKWSQVRRAFAFRLVSAGEPWAPSPFLAVPLICLRRVRIVCATSAPMVSRRDE